MAIAFLSSAISRGNRLEIGSKAPKIETIEGTNVVDDANSQGKTKVISFWSPKNPSSRIANSQLAQKYNGPEHQDVEFISICTDTDTQLANEVMKIDALQGVESYGYSEISPRVFKDYGADKALRAFKITPEGIISQIM